MSIVPPPASMINACSPGCERVKKPAIGGDSATDPGIFTRLGMGNAKVETSFSLGNKVDASMLNGGVLDKASLAPLRFAAEFVAAPSTRSNRRDSA